MKNAEKVMTALEEAYKGHRIEMLYVAEQNRDKIYVDGTLVGYFDDDFFNADFDNAEIEIKVKAPLKYFTDYLDITYDNENISKTEYIIRNAIGKGVRKWVDESHPNN